MKELIKIKNENGKQLVNARDLYIGLKFDDMDNFSRWIKKQLENVDAIENIDFIKTFFKDELSKTGQTKTDYALTIDTAKEICMVVGVAPRTNEETRKLSKQYRRYFIECEKKLKEVDVKANLLLSIYNGGQEGIAAAKKLTELEVEEATKPLLPKAEFYDKIIDSTTVIGMKEVADILKVKGYGRNNLFKFLRENGILNRKNEPYRKYIDQGLFEIKESKYIVDNEVKIKPTTYVTQKGLDYIRKLLNKQNKQ